MGASAPIGAVVPGRLYLTPPSQAGGGGAEGRRGIRFAAGPVHELSAAAHDEVFPVRLAHVLTLLVAWKGRSHREAGG